MYLNTFTHIKHFGNRFYRKKYHSKYEYFRSANLIQSPKRLLNILQPNITNHKLLDNLPVFTPLGVDFDADIKTTTTILETPHFHLNNLKIDGHDVIFFKKIIGDIKMNLQLHFLENKLFYIHNEIQHHLISNYLKNEEILQLMLERYDAGQLEGYDKRDVVLKDIQGNQIFTSNQVCFGINYLSGSPFHLEKARRIQSILGKKQEVKEAQQMKLLLNNI